MSNINELNLTPIDPGSLPEGQRIVRIGKYMFPVGSRVHLSFITAAADDIRSGKVGADTSGNPVYGTLVPGSGGGDVSSDEVKKFAIIF